MQWCRDMTQHATGFRWATGFLIVMLCLQLSLCDTEATNDQEQPKDKDIQTHDQTDVHQWKKNRHHKGTVHLLTGRSDGKVVPLHEDGFYIWSINHNTRNIFKLEDNGTSLVVPKKGLYIVNLKLYYYIPSGYKCEEFLFLSTCIKQYHPVYPEWTEVLKGIDTMQCVEHWRQSVTLSQVVRLEKEAKLRVIIDPKNYEFINGDHSTYFSVTLL